MEIEELERKINRLEATTDAKERTKLFEQVKEEINRLLGVTREMIKLRLGLSGK